MDGSDMKNLIRKARKGDAHAFGEIYGSLATELYRFAFYYMKNSHDAEDAVQNACLAAWDKIGGLKKENSFRSWFFKILYNECLKIHSSKPRRFEVSSENIEKSEEAVPDMCEKSDVLTLLDGLSEKERSIIILSVFEDYNSNEIAEILGMKPGSVRSALSRLLTKLRIQTEGAKNVQ